MWYFTSTESLIEVVEYKKHSYTVILYFQISSQQSLQPSRKHNLHRGARRLHMSAFQGVSVDFWPGIVLTKLFRLEIAYRGRGKVEAPVF